MAIDLEKMRVVIETNTSDFKKKCDEVKKEAHKAAEAADKELGEIGGKSGGKINTLRERIKHVVNAAKALSTAVKLDAGIIKETDGFKALKKQIDVSAEAIKRYKQLRDEAAAKGAPTQGWDDLVSKEEANYADLQGQHDDMVIDGSGFESAGAMSFGEKFKNVMGVAKQAAGQFFTGFQQGLSATHPALGKAVGAIGKVASVTGKIGMTAGKVAFAGIKKLAGGIKNLFSRAHGTGRSGLLGGITRMIAGLYLARRAMMFLVNGVKEGMNNLSQYSSSTNNTLSMLKSSLTQCKNALATAFAPILTAVAPLLNTLINWVTAAATALAHFFSALTGQKQTAIAVKVNQDYAKGLNNAAGAADNATESAEKYKRTLAGFDQINKLEGNDSGGSGSGGSGGGGGGLSPSDMFETVDVSSSAIDWANKFKEAWANADFTEIGRTVASKLKGALENIPWDEIQTTAGKIGASIATFLNGLFEDNSVWYTVGNTFAQAVNTIIEFGYKFVSKFDWSSFGEAIGAGINGIFENIKFAKAATAISNAFKGLLETGISAVETINWKKLGEDLADFLGNIDWVGIATKAIEFLGKALIGAIDGLSAFTKKIGEYLTNYFKSGKWLEDIKKAGALVLDISLNIIGSAWELLCSIIGTVLNVTAEIVGQTVGEVWKWIGAKITSVIEYTATQAGSVWDWIKKTVKSTIEYTAEKAKGKWEWLDKTFSGVVQYTAKKAKNWKKSIKGMSATIKSKVQFAAQKAGGLWKTVQNYASKGIKIAVAFKDTFTGAIKRAWNGIASGINAAVDIINKIPGVNIKKVPTIKAEGGIYKNGSWHPVTAAANGGAFDQGQMFIAREAGPELVGTIGGHTAVVNNDQIVASVSDGVYKAVVSAMSQSNDSKGLTVVLQGDAGKLFKVIRQEAQDYTMSTGRAAFPV